VLFCEVVEDLYSDHDESGYLIVKRHILSRVLPEDLMKEWDSFVLSQWIWENHHIIYGKWKSTEDLESHFVKLHRQTNVWVRTSPRTILRRPSAAPRPVPSPLPAVTPSLVASTATTVVPVSQDTLLPLLLLLSNVRLD